MGMEYYLFALFVFALSVILIVIVIYGTKRNKAKEDKERAKKEEKLMIMYFEVEDMIESLKEYVDFSREKTEADIRRIETDMQALSTVKESLLFLQENMQNSVNITQSINETIEPIENVEIIDENLKDKPSKTKNFESAQAEKDVDDIAKELNRSRSEIELMMKLKKLSNSEKMRKN